MTSQQQQMSLHWNGAGGGEQRGETPPCLFWSDILIYPIGIAVRLRRRGCQIFMGWSVNNKNPDKIPDFLEKSGILGLLSLFCSTITIDVQIKNICK